METIKSIESFHSGQRFDFASEYNVSMVEKIGPKVPRQRPYLKEWRKFRTLTQEELAERLDTTKASISRYETGARDLPGGFLGAFAEAVQCTEADLYRLPQAESSLDDMLRNAPERIRQQAREIIQTLLKTGT
jgi:transcriptional regulator with XRE-family HTH domain